MNTLKRLEDARPARLDPGPGQPSADLVGIMARSASPGVRRRPVGRLVLAGSVAAAVAAVAVVTVHSGRTEHAVPPPLPTTAAAPVSGRDLFLAAADRNLALGATTGRYWVTSVEHGEVRRVGPASRPYDILLRNAVDTWLPTVAGDRAFSAFQYRGAEPVTADDRAAWVADGSPTEWTESAPGTSPIVVKLAPEPRYARPFEDPTREWTFPLGEKSLTVAQLAALPTDPAALKASLPADAYSLFWSGLHLVLDLPVPAGVRVAAYRMLADAGGVEFLGPATDRSGRGGMAVAFTRRGDGGQVGQTRLIVDPASGQALAEESWNVTATPKLQRYTLVSGAGFSDATPPTDLPLPPSRR